MRVQSGWSRTAGETGHLYQLRYVWIGKPTQLLLILESTPRAVSELEQVCTEDQGGGQSNA